MRLIFASHHDKEALLGHIRHSIATLRTSELRVNDLRAGLGAVTERAKKEIAAANARADAAELRAASEAARANTAEQRWRESEARFGEILQVIASELDAPI
jgi:neutral trehalase